VLKRADTRPVKSMSTLGRIVRLIVLAAVVAGGYWTWVKYGDAVSGRSGQSGASRPGGPGAAPVRVATVEKKDFPVVLTGLGTVQATNSVVVRSRVDGQIEKVAFEEGQMLKEGDLLVQIDPAPFKAALDQAVAKLAQDEANLVNAKQELDRTVPLAKQGVSTQQQLDQRVATVNSLTALIEADKAAIASSKVQLNYTTIRSPLAGRAGFRLVDPGNIVHASDQNGILTITQLQPISVVSTAPEQELPAINEALEGGPLQVTALSSDGQRKLGEGTLRLVDNQVDSASGTIKLKGSFPNPANALWPGLSVTTRLVVQILKDVVVIPDTAVQRGPKGLYAYVVTREGKAELRFLKVGRIADGQAHVEEGLAAGERIITAGHYRVQPGGLVEIMGASSRPADTPAADKRVEATPVTTEVGRS
jgi:multidrug efflux system membrane fusion protein